LLITTDLPRTKLKNLGRIFCTGPQYTFMATYRSPLMQYAVYTQQHRHVEIKHVQANQQFLTAEWAKLVGVLWKSFSRSKNQAACSAKPQI